MKKLIILIGLVFMVSCASAGGESMGNIKPNKTYGGSHIVDRPSSPFVGDFDIFAE